MLKRPLILRISTLLKLKLKCSQNTAKKPSQFKNFPADMFLFGVRKNICIASFPDAQGLLSWNTLKANICMFLYISLRKFYFKDLPRFYLVVWGVGGGWIISLRGLSTLLKLKLQCSQNTAKKPFQFTNFPADMFLFGVRKKICIASFPDVQGLFLETPWKQIYICFCISL